MCIFRAKCDSGLHFCKINGQTFGGFSVNSQSANKNDWVDKIYKLEIFQIFNIFSSVVKLTPDFLWVTGSAFFFTSSPSKFISC